MPSKNDSITRAQESTIIQLIRRGDRVQQIAAILGIRPSQVEAVLDRYVAREMA